MNCPFIVIPNYFSPLVCESIISSLNFFEPEIVDKKVKKSTLFNKLLDNRLSESLNDAVDAIEDRFKCEVSGLAKFKYEWYPTGYEQTPAECENSSLVGNRWYRTSLNDFIITIVLNDHQEKVPFDPDYEVRGGRLEYPNHQFSFLPRRGMLIAHPANQNFLHGISSISAGSLNLIRIGVVCETTYTYDSEQFKGSYNVWFK